MQSSDCTSIIFTATTRVYVMVNVRLLWQFTRHCQTRVPSRTMSTEPREIKVPVPWGHIAGKEWGDPNGEPWLALHGWLDNCGTFDNLMPHFPPNHRLICLDLPGHGFSSHYPEGFAYHYLDGLQYIRRVANHYGLKQISLLGHSMGGGMSLIYAVTHPEQVKRLVMIDAVKPVSRSLDVIVQRTRTSVDDLMAIEKKLSTGKHNVYSYESALNRLMEGSNQIHGKESITVDSAKILLKRGLKKTADDEGWMFTRDLRHRVASLYGYNHEAVRVFAAGVKCPHLVVRAKEGNIYEKQENIDDILEVYKSTNPKFREVVVQGNHHVHLNHPENVWPAILAFLEEDNTQES